MIVDFVRLATPRTMTRDAYREFCWGTSLPETAEGYGLLLGHDAHSGDPTAAVISDVEYARLLVQSSSITVPADMVVALIPEWPDLHQDAVSVWD